MRRLTCAFAGIVGLLLTAACAVPAQGRTAVAAPRSSTSADASLPPGGCAAFALSIAPDAVGKASAIEAVNWFVARGEEPGYPGSGWHTEGHDELGESIASGGATLHVVQLPNGTWLVDEGRRC